jgi:hypothetical protein
MTPAAAIYARKSNEQNIAGEEKSVTFQIEEARRFIEAHALGAGADAHVYVDDGISGANFVTRSLLGLVQAAKASPRPFDVLVAMDVWTAWAASSSGRTWPSWTSSRPGSPCTSTRTVAGRSTSTRRSTR